MRIVQMIVIALFSCATVLQGQARESRSFNLYVENDAFVNSDTSYTNGLRLAWTLNRYKNWMPRAVSYLGPQGLLAVSGLFGMGKDTKNGNLGCQSGDARADRANGRCYMVLLGIGQTMYTPDTLLLVNLNPYDRPYSGFLFASFGAAYLDSPQERNARSSIVMMQVSNELILGTTGPAAFAQETQSFAHWTWASDRPRPLGWHNQLKGGLQAGLLTHIAMRTSWMEHCAGRAGCTGGPNEKRWIDFTPRTEVILGSYMRRASVGGVLRIGYNFPDNVASNRIPTTAPATTATRGCGSLLKCLCPEVPWFDLFFTADERWVQHNMFIEGGLRDTGPTGWQTVSQLDMRHSLLEADVLGFEAGTSHGSLSLQFVQRTPEYDVRGRSPFHGFHRYGSLNLSINSRGR